MTKITQMKHSAISTAKWAFTTRRVARTDAVSLGQDFDNAISGDLILAEVVSLGSHKKLQLASGRAATLYVGDLVVLCAGDRYAPDQFEGVCEFDAEQADMIAGGGLIGRMRQKNDRIAMPTQLKPLGIAARCERRSPERRLLCSAAPHSAPTDQNDWRCRRFNELRQNHGDRVASAWAPKKRL